MNPAENRYQNHYILHDSDLLKSFDPQSFDILELENQGRIVGQVQGRGNTYFITVDDLTCVLRHYRRGGFVANFSDDRYLWRNLFATRAWREWYFLGKMRNFDLNVPRPVAARVVRYKFTYTADLITEKIEGAISLGDVLKKNVLPDEMWRKTGATLRRFHQRGVYHADLNAQNILINKSDAVYLIDFDKCYLRQTKRSWQLGNLNRLKRSLEKLKSCEPNFKYSEKNWTELVGGYTQR